MTPNTLLQHFDLLAEAPNAVAKLRELVLHAAFAGKLVEQSDQDEPASVVLERSRQEMRRLAELGKVKREKPSAPIADEEVTSGLPPSWAMCRLADTGQYINGLAFKPSDWGTEGRPIIRIQNLSGRNLDYNRTKREVDSSVLVDDGDILVSWSATLDAFIWRGEQGVLNQHIFRVIPSLAVEPPFLYWLLKWVIRHLADSDHAHGLVMSHINRGPFLAYPIPLPPLTEQRRIVAKVDELMALCDRLEAQLADRESRRAALARAALDRFAQSPTPDNLQLLFYPESSPLTLPTSPLLVEPADLRKTILTLAVQGKLVEQDPEDEPVETSLPKLFAAAVEVEASQLPSHWISLPLGAAGDWLGGGTPSKSRADFWSGELPWVSPKDMKVTRISDAQDHISIAAVEGSSVRMIPTGSLLMVVRGMILARAFPVALTTREVTINQDMKALVPSEHQAADYLLLALRALEPEVLAVIQHSSHGTCKLPTELLHNTLLPVPPLAEQRRIVARVDELMALVDQLEAQLADARTRATQLLDAVVAEVVA